MTGLVQRLTAVFAGAPATGMPAAQVRRSAYRSAASPARVQGIDQPLVWVTVALLAFGLVMVYSATIALPDNPKFALYGRNHFLVRHAGFMALSFVVSLLAFQVPIAAWEKLAPWLFVGSLLLLIVVLVPHVGKGVNGAHRWIGLGFMSFQPSELAKFAVLLYAADYMVRKMDVKERFFRAVLPMAAAVAVVGVLLLAEPDMGAFMVIAVIAMGILFLGGVNARMFFLIAAVIVVAFGLMIALSDWRRERIFAYLDPWSEKHALGKGYQLSHSLIAIGLIGVLTVIGLFLWMTRRIMHIGRQAIALDRVFAGLVAQGVGIWIGFQAFINMGVNLGALPTKGLTLPLMSYGGSAILMNLVSLAVVLRIDYENKLLMRGGRP
jgi:cell division protein FtsW